MPDMDWQEKGKTQTMSPLVNNQFLFTDERTMRAPVEGSVARGELQTDTEFYQGIKKDYKPAVSVTTVGGPVLTSLGPNPQDQDPAAPATPAAEDVSMFVDEFPPGIEVNEELLARGQQRFNIYCSVCHGYSGNGDGLVNQRAVALAANSKATWTTAKSLHDPIVKDPKQNPLGRIFDTITHGRSTMGPYGDQIPPQDRWAIVAYVKALQETGIQPPGAVTEEAKAKDDAAKPSP